ITSDEEPSGLCEAASSPGRPRRAILSRSRSPKSQVTRTARPGIAILLSTVLDADRLEACELIGTPKSDANPQITTAANTSCAATLGLDDRQFTSNCVALLRIN